MAKLRKAAVWAAWFGVAFLVWGPTIAGRNGSGTYSVPNTFSAGQTITASGFNQNFSDIGTELTNSVAADGQTSMTGPLKAATGSASAPSYTFSAETTTGFYRAGSGQIGIAVGGTNVATITATGITNYVSTGDVKLTIKTTADTGWVMMNDGTIGSASSGATTRANADTEALFTLLWTNCADAQCAVSSGRGANAAADFAANKTIALPKVLGRSLASAGAGSGLTSRLLGAVVGAESTTIAQSNLPSGALSGSSATLSNADLGVITGSGQVNVTPGSGISFYQSSSYRTITSNSSIGSVNLNGSGTALSLFDPTSFAINVMIKL